MYSKLLFSKYKLVVAIIFIASTSFSFAQKPNLKKITSKENSKKVQNNIPTSAPSQIPSGLNRHSIGIGIGQTFLLGDFKDNGADSITPDLYYNYSASHSFDLLINGHYSTHRYQNRYVILQGVAVGIKAKLIHFDNFHPFALAGLGLYQPKVRRIISGSTIATSKSQMTFGYHFGAGGELTLNHHFALSILGHFHNPFDVKQDVGPEVEGTYFKLIMALFYTF